MKYSGADWIKSQSWCEGMSELGIEVADLLGDLYFGIYHMNETSLSKVDWSNEHYIQVTIDRPMGTVDGNTLTMLVVFSHDRMLRVEVSGSAPGYMKLLFHKRTKHKGWMHERIPVLETHIDMIRGYFEEEHERES